MPLVFLVCLLIWIGAGYILLQKQDLYRLFGFLMASFVLYISFELTMWSFQLPLPVMMCIGLLPVVAVAYGYRVYDYKRQETMTKRKNDDKLKHDETVVV